MLCISKHVYCVTIAVLLSYPAFSFMDTTITKNNKLAEWKVVLPEQVQKGVMTELNVELTNTSSKEWTGYLVFELFDSTKNSVDGLCYNVFPNQYFTLEYKKQATVKFPFTVPLNFTGPLSYTIKMFDTAIIDSVQSVIKIKR